MEPPGLHESSSAPGRSRLTPASTLRTGPIVGAAPEPEAARARGTFAGTVAGPPPPVWVQRRDDRSLATTGLCGRGRGPSSSAEASPRTHRLLLVLRGATDRLDRRGSARSGRAGKLSPARAPRARSALAPVAAPRSARHVRGGRPSRGGRLPSSSARAGPPRALRAAEGERVHLAEPKGCGGHRRRRPLLVPLAPGPTTSRAVIHAAMAETQHLIRGKTSTHRLPPGETTSRAGSGRLEVTVRTRSRGGETRRGSSSRALGFRSTPRDPEEPRPVGPRWWVRPRPWRGHTHTSNRCRASPAAVRSRGARARRTRASSRRPLRGSPPG